MAVRRSADDHVKILQGLINFYPKAHTRLEGTVNSRVLSGFVALSEDIQNQYGTGKVVQNYLIPPVK